QAGAHGLLEAVDDLADVLGAVTVDDEEGVARVDNHDVVDADGRDDTPGLGPDDAVRGVDLHHVAAHGIAALVAFDQLTEAVPVADVRPTHLRRHHSDARRMLHDPLIDGDVRQRGPDLRGHALLLAGFPGGRDLPHA